MQRLLWIFPFVLALAAGSSQATGDEPPRHLWIPKEQLIPVWDRDPPFSSRQHHAAQLSGPKVTPRPVEALAAHTSQGAIAADDSERTASADTRQGPSVDSSQPLSLEQARRDGNWGPLKTGDTKFALHSNPLDLAELQHLYHRNDLTPVNFEDIMGPTHYFAMPEEMKTHRLQIYGSLFHPEPSLLSRIQAQIWDHLLSENIMPHQSHEGQRLKEGEYLWPPMDEVSSSAGNLEVPPSILKLRLRQVVTHRIGALSEQAKDGTQRARMTNTLFHMELSLRDRTRHVLMVKMVRPGNFVEPTSLMSDSRLWFFYEAVLKQSKKRTHNEAAMPVAQQPGRRLAFLGASYLPEKAQDKLLAAGVIKPAFEEYFRSLRL